jgi:hypothetical protein
LLFCNNFGHVECDKENDQTIQWVSDQVPVEIIGLFLCNGPCSDSSNSLVKDESQRYNKETLCGFVRNIAEQYVSPGGDDDVVRAITLMHERANKQPFRCSDLKNIQDRKSGLKLKDRFSSNEAMHDLYIHVIEILSNSEDSQSCEHKCKKLGTVCDIAATLTNLTLEKANTAGSPDKATTQVIDWVKSGVPVVISQLFVPDSHCAVSKAPVQQQTLMCKFVENMANYYVKAKPNNANSENSAYVSEAIGSLSNVNNNDLDFDCSHYPTIVKNAKSLKKRIENETVKVPSELKKHISNAIGVFTKPECKKVCGSMPWRAVCGVTAALLDILPEMPSNSAPLTGKICIACLLCLIFCPLSYDIEGCSLLQDIELSIQGTELASRPNVVAGIKQREVLYKDV